MSTIDDKVNRATYLFLNQSAVWYPKDASKPIAIDRMDDEWRYNASRLLERQAAALELRYSIGELTTLGAPTLRTVVGEVDGKPVEDGPRFSHLDLMGEHARDAFDAELEARVDNPVAWIRRTPLYRALVDGLPTDAARLEALAKRAQHFSTCQVRNGQPEWCTCPPITD